MANLIKMGTGNMISYAPIMSCLGTGAGCSPAPTNDHQRATLVIAATTQIDNQAEEQTLGIETRITTGAKSAWTAGTGYAAGANVVSGADVYRAAAACTSGATAPTLFGNSSQQQSDGGCTWTWINAANIAGKLSLYVETAAEGGAGFSEGHVTNFQMQDAAHSSTGKAFDVTQGAFGVEHDFKNNAADCVVGVANCIGMHFFMGGPYKSTSGISIDGGGGSHGGSDASTYWGMLFANNLASEFDIDFRDTAKTMIGIGVDGIASITHAGASIRDGSTAPVSYSAEGANSDAAIKLSGSGAAAIRIPGSYASQISGVGFNVDSTGQQTATGSGIAGFASTGTHGVADFISNSSSPIGLQVLGSHASGQIVGTGFSFDASGNLSAPNATLSGTLKFGSYAAGACTNAGYMTVLDLGGNTRKVMICG